MHAPGDNVAGANDVPWLNITLRLPGEPDCGYTVCSANTPPAVGHT